MRFIDCTWEIANIGHRTCEISYEIGEEFNKVELLEKTQSFEYIVVKVPMNHPVINIGLAGLGFVLIETQINISKKFKDFNFNDRLVKQLYPHVTEQIVSTEGELDVVLNRMTPNMFSTDRIYLDPYFSPETSRNRYANWVKTEFLKGSSDLKRIMYNGEDIGFFMSREHEGVLDGLLGGIYEGRQSEGLGFLTACSCFISAYKNNNPFKKVFTAISSNNVPMWQIYDYLQFKIDKMNYVFVKHND